MLFMEREIKTEMNLLGKAGHITADGWARKPLWKYERKKIKAPLWRIKEWDYYLISNQEEGWAIAVTFSSLSLFSLYSISYMDLNRKEYSSLSSIKLFTFLKEGLAESAEAEYDLSYYDKKMTIALTKREDRRHIIATAPDLVLPDGRRGLKINLTLFDAKEDESINIASSWEEKRECFYYNQKRLSMPVEGKIIRENNVSEIKEGTAFALLDWGRGNWVRKSTWYWGAFMSKEENRRIALNMGYGFSDRSKASENAIFIDGAINKTGTVSASIPEDFLSRPWSIKDSEGKIDLTFTPLFDRKDHRDLKIISSLQDQVFGIYSGFVRDLDGTEIEIRDTYGFFEKVSNNW